MSKEKEFKAKPLLPDGKKTFYIHTNVNASRLHNNYKHKFS
jgi:hypothetical protein